MNNFVFEEEGIRVFKAYGVGHGHLIPKSTIEKISSNFAFDETRMKVYTCSFRLCVITSLKAC